MKQHRKLEETKEIIKIIKRNLEKYAKFSTKSLKIEDFMLTFHATI